MKEQSAREALEDLQGKAIILPDGRRVYFTSDGIGLYGEDDQEITDVQIVRDAAQRLLSTPDAPSYEDFIERRKTRDRAAEDAQRLKAALERLNELTEKAKTGKFSAHEIEDARKEAEAVMDSLPPEVRDRYDRLREARHGKTEVAYRAADPAFEALPVMRADFQQAMSAMPQEKKAYVDEQPASAPTYKPVPPF